MQNRNHCNSEFLISFGGFCRSVPDDKFDNRTE